LAFCPARISTDAYRAFRGFRGLVGSNINPGDALMGNGPAEMTRLWPPQVDWTLTAERAIFRIFVLYGPRRLSS